MSFTLYSNIIMYYYILYAVKCVVPEPIWINVFFYTNIQIFKSIWNSRLFHMNDEWFIQKNWKKVFFAQAIESKITTYLMLIIHWITITFQFLSQENEENKNTDFSLKFAHLTLRFIQFICVFYLKVELCYENKYYYENQFFCLFLYVYITQEFHSIRNFFIILFFHLFSVNIWMFLCLQANF